MKIRELSIPDAFEITPVRYGDSRGTFHEWYRADALAEAVGHPLTLRQGNSSTSKLGVVRGIHFADLPPGQAKYVTAVSGAVLDFVIDIRVGSPTFGKWDAVHLDDVDNRSIYIAEGLGHAFVALTDDARVSYLVTDTFRPDREHGVNPLDAEIGLDFPLPLDSLILSQKDTDAPSLAQAAAAGLLPLWSDVKAFSAQLDAEARS